MEAIHSPVVLPILAMLFLPFLVLTIMFYRRVQEMKSLRIHPQTIALRSQSSAKFQNTCAADNLLNLFELPVIFYVLGIIILILKMESTLILTSMWIFVIFRYIHSLIHCTYNKVMHRFYAFLSSVIVLFFILLQVIRLSL